MNEDSTDPKVTAAAKPAASRAPYQDAPAREREVLDPQRPWLEAGRSHLAAAERLLAESRRTGGALARWQTPDAVTALRTRGKAAAVSAKLLAPLNATGWVVLHDRVLAGTSAGLDHVLVGPVGIVVVQNRPTRQVGVDQTGTLWADGVPLHPEREQLRWAMLEVLNRSAKVLGEGWYVYAYPFLVLHTASPWAPDLREPACLLKPDQMRWTLSTYKPGLTSMHVADLAMVVEDICPPAPLQQP